ncbi:MAG: 3-hydroxyacyl-CoA dehydrogenase NAD-binding domain-containing protein, partial [Calditrichia bacterium]
MTDLNKETVIGVIGAGTMGRGIAQVAATSGHIVKIYEVSEEVRKSATGELRRILNRLAEKGKLTPEEADGIYHRIHLIENMVELADCSLIFEAVVEETKIKRLLFKELETIVNPDTILATNTSSLSITGIASACSD